MPTPNSPERADNKFKKFKFFFALLLFGNVLVTALVLYMLFGTGNELLAGTPAPIISIFILCLPAAFFAQFVGNIDYFFNSNKKSAWVTALCGFLWFTVAGAAYAYIRVKRSADKSPQFRSLLPRR